MTRHLLDVNVLLALVNPRHRQHAAARSWFERTGGQAWATNPLTQLGVLRLLTNPAVTQIRVNASTAIELLSLAIHHPGHQFWPLDESALAGLETLAPHITGHQQWTDALLLCQAKAKGTVLATFDSGLKQMAAGAFKNHVLLLKNE
jgi:toxin-antitoxin system PIN domain toxin